ncbi:MAG: diguanylate cyclase [Gammaproteobacteria bacterium]|nr:diguanylate cyclase [Gammaproteobacteria bacterium]
MNILIADDEVAIRTLVGELLTDEGHNVTLAEDGQDALEKFRASWHEIVFSDIRMPNMTGIELLAEVKEINENTQFIIMTSHASVENSIAALKKGAFDYIIKPFDELDIVVDAANRAIANLSAIREQQYLLSTLSRQNSELSDLNKKFRDLSIRDGLTGLYNHRHAKDRIDEEFERSKSFGRDLSILFMDVDNFKFYNDTHGHQPGDDVLKTIGGLLGEVTRDSDVVARWGGEEFIVIAAETNMKQACKLAEVIRKKIAANNFPHGNKQPLGLISISIGVATISDTTKYSEDLVKLADDALYRAKEAGRNRTVFCSNYGEMTEV